MRTHSILLLLVFLSLVFLWSCEKDIQTENLAEISVRAPGNGNGGGQGNGNGNGGGGGSDDDNPVEPLFEVVFDGAIVNSTATYGVEVTNNKKYELMQTDACGFFEIFGITSLIGCASIIEFCDDGVGLRQFDKRRNPGRVSCNIWFLDPDGNHNFKMFGSLTNSSTIFPETENVSSIIHFDKWELAGPINDTNGCSSNGEIFFTNSGQIDASVTITRIDDGVCPNSGASTCL